MGERGITADTALRLAKLLKESLQKLGSDAVVEIFPAKDHSTLMDGDMRARISKEIADSFRKAVGKRKS